MLNRSSFLPAWDTPEGIRRSSDLFVAAYGSRPAGVWAAPGRVNLIGEHLDYNGGFSLPFALPHRTFVALAPRADEQVRLVSDLAPDAVWSGTLDDLGPGRASGWVAYAGGPAWVLRDEGVPVRGFDAAVASCVPLGAGLSSSAALETAVALALDEVFNQGALGADDAGRARLAAACVRAENEVAGAATGGMDQAVALRSTLGHALLIDSSDASVTQVPLDLEAADLTILVIDTRAPHALADGQYASRRATCERAAARLGVRTLCQVEDPEAALGRLEDRLEIARARHVFTEQGRVRRVVEAVSAGRLREIGPDLDASHASLAGDYEVSCPELDVAVEAARRAGALGARMTGGGFGGSAIALVERAKASAVRDAVAASFAAHGFAAPEFLVASASAPGGRVG
nr:galactokinase [Propionibacterium sp.]